MVIATPISAMKDSFTAISYCPEAFNSVVDVLAVDRCHTNQFPIAAN